MTETRQVYKCPICGNIVEVLHSGVGQLVCCGQPMVEEKPNADDSAALEKHVPVITETENGFTIQIGETKHPMTPEHYIEWIELVVDGRVYRKELNAGDEPVAEFCVDKENAKNFEARGYCNLHHLWIKKG